MSNVHVTKSSPADYADNPARGAVQDYTTPTREYRPAPELHDWRVILARAAVGVIVVAIYGLWKTAYCWSWTRFETCATIALWEPFAIIMAALISGALAVWHYAARNAMTQAQATRTNLVLDRFGNQYPADLFQRMTTSDALIYLEQRYTKDIALKMHTAQYEQYWSVNTLTSPGNTSIATTITPQLTEGDQVAGNGLVPDSEWMQWIDKTPHLLLSARTNAGKTTLAMAILAARAGEPLLILDPHDQPDKWFGMRAVGGGRDFDAILEALAGVLDEMDRRFKAYDQGTRTDSFERLTVLIDETPALVAHTMDGTKIIDPRWKGFAKKLGSEARKVRISAILLTQSPLVQDIQISSYMRENFTRVALGDQVSGLLSEEKDTARRLELADLLRGRAFSAAMEYKGEIHVLNTDNVPRLAQMPVGRAVMWRPSAYMPVVSASVRPSATVSTSFSPADLLAAPAPDGRTADGQRTRLYLKAMAGAGKTRDYARQRMTMLGMPFENKLWTEVRTELGLD